MVSRLVLALALACLCQVAFGQIVGNAVGPLGTAVTTPLATVASPYGYGWNGGFNGIGGGGLYEFPGGYGPWNGWNGFGYAAPFGGAGLGYGYGGPGYRVL